MALTPDTAAALKQALQAVQQECGDDPQYADLVDALHTAEQAIPEGEHAPAEHDAPAADDAGDDPYSFDQAEKKHKAARSNKGEDDGGNPFAKKGA